MKLRWLLFLAFTLISAVPVFMLAVWVDRSAIKKEISAVEEKHLLLAHNLSYTLSRYVQDVEATFRLVVANLNQGTMIANIDQLLTTLDIQTIFIVDQQNIRQHGLHPTPSLIQELPPVSALHALRQSAQAAEGNLVFSDLTRHNGEPAFLIGQALAPNHLAIGILNTNFLITTQEAVTFGERGHAMIVDHAGKVVAHPSKEWQATSKDASALSVVQAMKRGETGVSFFYSPPMQAEMVAGYTVVPKVGWGVMVPQPMQELRQRAGDVKVIALGLALLGMTIAGILSWRLSKSLARPIEAIRRTARAIAQGALDTRIPRIARHAPMELKDLARSLNRMVDRLQNTNAELSQSLVHAKQANQAKSEFLTNISHELRTPLHGMLLLSQIGSHKGHKTPLPKLLDYFGKIEASGQTLLNLINDLLDLAKLETGKMQFTFAPTNLNLLLEQMADEFASLAAHRQLQIECHLPTAPVLLQCDAERFKQVLRNLLSNAVKFSPDSSTIQLTLQAGEQTVNIGVHDQGLGIPEAEVQTIFDPFIQSSTTHTGAGGTGLGLAICQEIVTAHQGHIWATNHPNGGASLQIELPLIAPLGVHQPPSASPVLAQPASHAP